MVGRGDLQETTSLIGEVTSVAWPIQTHFIKNAIIFFKM